MFIELLVLFVSLFVLSKSSSYVVDSLVKISVFFGINQLSIGFILLAVSTSIPELSVSFLSSSQGNGALAAGNVFGSNTANILLILGAGAFLYGFKCKKVDLKNVGIVLVATTVISLYIIFNNLFEAKTLGFAEGMLLLVIFVLYAWYMVSKKKLHDGQQKITGVISKKDALYAFLVFLVGIFAVIFSSHYVVDSAVSLSKILGLAESFIGATLVALGTSLPELSIDLQAIRKKQYGLALGDAIGSNMVNLTLVLGTAAVLNPITVTLPVFFAALLFAVLANMLLFYASAVDQKMHRVGGAIFLILYVIYLISIAQLQWTVLT